MTESLTRYADCDNKHWIDFFDRYPRMPNRLKQYVYFLREYGKEEIKYIGITFNPLNRFTKHKHNGQRNAKKREWINQIGADRLEIEFVFLGEEREAQRLEYLLIEKYKDQLVNGRAGYPFAHNWEPIPLKVNG
jgi:predicted GIY-YIG superfamily endonuclease